MTRSSTEYQYEEWKKSGKSKWWSYSWTSHVIIRPEGQAANWMLWTKWESLWETMRLVKVTLPDKLVSRGPREPRIHRSGLSGRESKETETISSEWYETVKRPRHLEKERATSREILREREMHTNKVPIRLLAIPYQWGIANIHSQHGLATTGHTEEEEASKCSMCTIEKMIQRKNSGHLMRSRIIGLIEERNK